MREDEIMARGLTDKQRIFCIEYVKCHNATEAARIVGYKQAHVQGPRMLDNVSIQEELNRLEGNLEIDLRAQFSKEAEKSFKDLIHMRDNLLSDTVELVKVLSDGTIIRYEATDTAVVRLRREINESILDRAGYRPVEKKQIEATVSLEDALTELEQE